MSVLLNKFGQPLGWKMSRFFTPTLKDDPAEAEVVSHKLLIRAGFIRKLAAGIYSYLPLGLRSLLKVERIIREEMNLAGAQEVLLPAVQPAELWKESGRWDYYGQELLRFKDRHDRDCVIGPTHEEVITDLARREIRSWRDLPKNFYQIQTKFRDEIRPRFGLMRGREFIMKDAYSFDADEAGAELSYQAMYQAYAKIFERCGLSFAAVEADSGAIGGSFSHEFMVLADTGEDALAACPSCGYAANLEKAALAPAGESQKQDLTAQMAKTLTPGCPTVELVAAFLNLSPAEIIKSLLFDTAQGPVMVLLPGDREVNLTKLKNLTGAAEPQLVTPEAAARLTGGRVGYLGPIGLNLKIIADHGLKAMPRGVAGANDGEHHLTGVVPGRDFEVAGYFDLVTVRNNDPCPKCGRPLAVRRGIEVGHVFKLGVKYSQALKAVYADRDGRDRELVMGCYGIGVGRTMAAAVEQNHDADGIIWPVALAPFEAAVLPLRINKPQVMEAAQNLYRQLLLAGVETLFDDRDERPGAKFKDADLIGIPFRLAVSEKSLAQDKVELKIRNLKEPFLLPLAEAGGLMAGLKGLCLASGSLKAYDLLKS